MRQNIYTIIAASALFGLASCEKENAFNLNESEGMIDCKSLDVDYIGGGQLVRATEENGISVGSFTVDFIKSDTGTAEKSYTYSDMPQLVTLPISTYKIQAHYGDNKDAAWNEPYYFGEATGIIVKANETTNVPNAITCKLNNIKVKVNIDDNNLGLVTNYSVKISAGKSSLTYDSSHEGDTAYFKYISGSNTITAVFSGTIDGETKQDAFTVTYEDAVPGNSYTINFTLTKPENGKEGNISFGDTSINIDTTIDVKNETHTATPDTPNDEIINDDRDKDREPSSNESDDQ